MTFAYAAFTLGAMLVYSGITNTSVSNILTGGPKGDIQSPNILGGAGASSTGGNTGGVSTGAGSGGNLKGSYTPGSSTYKGVVICNWIIAIIKAAEQDVGSLQPTSGVRPGVDPHTASGLSCHSGCAKGSGPGTGAVDFGSPAGSPSATKFAGWLAKNGNPMIQGKAYGDLGHFSRDGS